MCPTERKEALGANIAVSPSLVVVILIYCRAYSTNHFGDLSVSGIKIFS